MALKDFVRTIKKSALLAHLKGVDEATAKCRKDLLDAVVTKDELLIQIDYLSNSHTTLTDRDAADQHPADSIETDVTDFDGALSASDTDVQLALETLDTIASNADHAIHDNVSGEINAIAEKTDPIYTDLFVIEDSESSYDKKKIQMGKIVIGGSSQDDVIEFTDDEGYEHNLTLAENAAIWYNVEPPEEFDSTHWLLKFAQNNN